MDTEPPPAKRPRLSMACNECRRRKVKCDTETPKCRNCHLRNETCTTTDPKQPHVPISRVWVEQPERAQSVSVPTQNGTGNVTSSESPGLLDRLAPRRIISHSPRSTSATWGDEKGISPAQQPYEMAFNMDSTDRIKMMGASSSQCLMKSFDIYLEAVRIKPLSGNFKHGMRHAEEMEIPLIASLPALPPNNRRQEYISVFLERIHPLYPLFDIDKLKSTIEQLSSMSEFISLPQEQVPWLATSYLIMSISADEEAQNLTEDGTRYLTAAASLLGNVTFMPYLPAIQCLLLFTVTFRGRNKDGVGWQTLGMATRLAFTLGIHRHSFKSPSSQHRVQDRYMQLFHARIWAICCSLEKMMQLESGRPSMIQDVDRDHMIAPDQHPPGGHDFLQWHMGLAQHQGLISHHIYGHKPGDRLARELLSDTASLDRSLLSWTREIPEEFRPGNDLFCSTRHFHIAASISIQYYQTVIALHRAALIAPASTFTSEVSKHCFEDSSRLRLQAGESICVNSARSIARLGLELSDRNIQSRIISGGPFILACIVLGISLMKNPASRMIAADLELLKSCADYTSDLFLKSGHNAAFAGGITAIHQQVRLHIDRKSNEPPNNNGTYRASMPVSLPTHQEQQISQHFGRDRVPPFNQPNYYNNVDDGSNAAANALEKFRNHGDSVNTEILNLDMAGPGPLESHQNMYSNSLPFDHLNVQELWNWMGNLDGFDTMSYQGPYEGSGSV